jgi:hypothetical protein
VGSDVIDEFSQRRYTELGFVEAVKREERTRGTEIAKSFSILCGSNESPPGPLRPRQIRRASLFQPSDNARSSMSTAAESGIWI